MSTLHSMFVLMMGTRGLIITLSSWVERSAPYFRDCLSAQDLDDLNIEIIRNTVRTISVFTSSLRLPVLTFLSYRMFNSHHLAF